MIWFLSKCPLYLAVVIARYLYCADHFLPGKTEKWQDCDQCCLGLIRSRLKAAKPELLL